MGMPEPPWASGQGSGSGSSGSSALPGGVRGFESEKGKGACRGAGGPVWVEGGSHRSGFKIRVTGFPPAAVQPIDTQWVHHWLRVGWNVVDPRARTVSAEELVAATVDVNWNHRAVSGGGRSLSSAWSASNVASLWIQANRFVAVAVVRGDGGGSSNSTLTTVAVRRWQQQCNQSHSRQSSLSFHALHRFSLRLKRRWSRIGRTP